jgi:hypothetical protein
MRSTASDRGAVLAEYFAVLLLVAAIVVAFFTVGVPGLMAGKVSAAVCAVFSAGSGKCRKPGVPGSHQAGASPSSSPSPQWDLHPLNPAQQAVVSYIQTNDFKAAKGQLDHSQYIHQVAQRLQALSPADLHQVIFHLGYLSFYDWSQYLKTYPNNSSDRTTIVNAVDRAACPDPTMRYYLSDLVFRCP